METSPAFGAPGATSSMNVSFNSPSATVKIEIYFRNHKRLSFVRGYLNELNPLLN